MSQSKTRQSMLKYDIMKFTDSGWKHDQSDLNHCIGTLSKCPNSCDYTEIMKQLIKEIYIV